MISKHMTIMVKHEVQKNPTESVYFERERDDSEDLVEGTYIDIATWEAMGRPEVVTVSVEPGDLLNEGTVLPEAPKLAD